MTPARQYGLALVMMYYEHVGTARDFYVEKFGFTPVPEFSSDDFAFMRPANGTPVALVTRGMLPPGVPPQPGGVQLSLEVADVDAAYEALTAHGVDVVSEITDMGAGRNFLVRDPGGHVLNVYAMYAQPRSIRAEQGM